MEKRATEFYNILVPVSSNDTGEQAIRLACGLAKKGKSKICAVYVVTVSRALPVEAEIQSEIEKGEDILDYAEGVGEEQGWEIETDVLQAREVAPAIVDEAAERGADLILMGTTPKTRFGRFTVGNVVPYVLKNAPCRVILYQYASPPAELL